MATIVTTLRTISERHRLTAMIHELDNLERDPSITAGFLGDFSSGKSALINAFVGEDVMPTSVEVCTSAALAVAVEGQAQPAFFRLEEDGCLVPVERASFEDMARGISTGRPVAHLAPRQGFPAGFVLVDTAGLGGLVDGHREVTLGELPFMDAAVLCVDIQKGGLSDSISTFLRSPGVRHLRQRFLLALTHSDLMPSTVAREKIRQKVVASLAQVVECSESEASNRVFFTSAGTGTSQRDTTALAAAMSTVIEARRSALTKDRLERCAQRLVPGAIHLLDQARQALKDSDPEFAQRRAEIDVRQRSRQEARAKHGRDLEELQSTLRREINTTCERSKAPLASARDAAAVEVASADFAMALTSVVQREFQRFGETFTAEMGAHTAEMKVALARTNRVADISATIATGALTAYLFSGAGVAANLAEGAGGAVAQGVGQQAAIEAGKKGAQGLLKAFALSALKALDDINPVNMMADLLAEQVKSTQLDPLMDGIAASVARDASRELAAFYQREYFDVIDREIASTRDVLDEMEQQRRQDLGTRKTAMLRLTADIELLRASLEAEG